MNKKTRFRKLTSFLLISCVSTSVWSSSKGSYGYGKDFDRKSDISRTMTDLPVKKTPARPARSEALSEYDESFESASSFGGSDSVETRLDDISDIRKHMFKKFLEITPENYEGLLQYSEMYTTSFSSYDLGLFVKRWKSSLGTDSLLDLLLKFTNINKFKIEIVWDNRDVDMSETISRSVQFFGNLGELTLSKCQLTDSGLEDILESLKNPDSLKILDIRENRLSESILPKIREYLMNLIDLKTDLKQTASTPAHSSISAAGMGIGISSVTASPKSISINPVITLTTVKPAISVVALSKIAPPITAVERTITAPRFTIPEIARGYEAIYERFMAGSLIYSPTDGSTVGQIVMPIASIANPNTLEGTFDLSRCGDAGKYLSIATGYRKSKLSANKDKLEIWITPKFVMENALSTSATHYGPIMTSDKWTAPIGIIWTYGNWADKDGDCDYLTNKQFDDISSKNLYENWARAVGSSTVSRLSGTTTSVRAASDSFLIKF